VLAAVALVAALLGAPAAARTPEPAPPAADGTTSDLPPLDTPPANPAPVQPDTGPRSVGALVETGDGLEVITVEAGPGELAQVQRELARDPDVVDVFVDVPARIAAVPDDPERGRQWNLDELAVDDLPDGTPDGAGTVVAVLDTGVRATHPDLLGRVDCGIGADFSVTSARSVGNGCTDPHGHGTHVAGVVSAVRDNGTGVAGLSAATIMPVRVLGADGSGMAARINAGIIWAVDHGADVINLSIVSERTTAYDKAIEYALDRGVVAVAAAGNNRATGNRPQSPASTPGVVSVAASDELGLSSAFSYSGPTVSVSAPGSDIWSTTPGGYAAMSGTSMAAPHVAAVVARYLSGHPGAPVAQVRDALRDTAEDLEQPGRDDNTGAGLVDVSELLTGVDPPDDPGRGAVPGAPRVTAVVPGVDEVTVRWTPPTWDGGSPLTSYSVRVLEVVDGALQDAALVSPGAGATQATVGGLTRGALHVVVVAANNPAAGQWSVTSDAVRVPTTPGAPRMGTPNAGPGAARVRWSAPASTGGSRITGYVVKVYRGWTRVHTATVPATAREVRIAGLVNGRAHTFVVQAVNAVGAGPHSDRSIPVTPRQVPGAPWIGRPAPGNDAVRVYWTAPKSNGGAYISAYVVKVYQGTRGVRSVTVPGTATSALITGLGHRGWYSFTVTARNAVGAGAASARSATVRTT
jgi:subtilisin family serine protease